MDMNERTDTGLALEALLGNLLQTLAASKPNGRFLQLGATNGMRTAWLLSGMDSSAQLVCVDGGDAEAQHLAIKGFGSDERVSFLQSENADFLAAQDSGSFDMVFVQATATTLDELEGELRVVRVGGFFVFDYSLFPPTRSEIPILTAHLLNHPDFRLLPLQLSARCVALVKRQ